jgi:pyruvate dehydrogenase E1 component alpha subunit
MLLECLTHRRRGHYEGDQQTYRDPAAEAEWERLDPISRLRDRARQAGWLDDHAMDELEQAARAEVAAAVEFSRASPFPDPKAGRELVYAK